MLPAFLAKSVNKSLKKKRSPAPKVPSKTSTIRNIQQSVQSRDVIKQAADVIVYIDGQDYLINPYLGIAGQAIPLNNFVNSWQSSYATDMMTPSGTLTLMVPIQDDHLFRGPGGNNILKTMAEIRVFAKGYYFSVNQNTLYHQIFKGFITSINYNMTGKMTTISISCSGALGMLEKMQVELSPSVMSSSPQEMVGFTSTNWNFDPYQSIAWAFLYSSMIDGFVNDSLVQARMDGTSVYAAAMSSPYIAKWQALLYDIARDVHIFGCQNVVDILQQIKKNTKPSDAANESFNKQNMGAVGDLISTFSETVTHANQNDFYERLRHYMPDMGISTIQLLNGRTTSRLERLRYMTELIGFEAYQDIDGAVIIKPPLYNLDVMMLEPSADSGFTPHSSLKDMTDATNPFVVQLSEISSESEVEDEAAVKVTRITARGSYCAQFSTGLPSNLQPTAEDIDIAKLSQFGLRTEKPVECHWYENGDPHAVYAYAASEMAKANRAFRTYSVVIPMRPELKLGFPMYFPHKDCYGYIRSVSMNWVRGSAATTSITVDSLRRRPLFPVDQPVTDPGPNQHPKTIRLMTPHINLINKLTTPPKGTEHDAAGHTWVAAHQPGWGVLLPLVSTLPLATPVSAQERQMIAARQAGTDYGINSDDTTLCWRIQPDTDTPAGLTETMVDGKVVKSPAIPGKPLFDKEIPLSEAYYNALRGARPYTDGKGYEVVGPFPWGRFKSLKEALTIFTIQDALGEGTSASSAIHPVNEGADSLTDAAAFLFTGDSVAAVTDSALTLIGNLETQTALIKNYKVFELSYEGSTGTTTGAPPSTLTANTPTPPKAATAEAVAKTMVSHTPTFTSIFKSIIHSIPLSWVTAAFKKSNQDE